VTTKPFHTASTTLVFQYMRWTKSNLICIIKSLRSVEFFFFMLLKENCLCSPRLHLKTVILWNTITILNTFFFFVYSNIFKIQFISVICETEFPASLLQALVFVSFEAPEAPGEIPLTFKRKTFKKSIINNVVTYCVYCKVRYPAPVIYARVTQRQLWS